MGYGDFFPKTAGGRFLVGVPLLVLGVGLLGFMLSVVATALISARNKEAKGMNTARANHHVVVVHYPGTTKLLRLMESLCYVPDAAVSKEVESGLTAWIAVEYMRIEEASRQGLMVMAGYARSATPPDVQLLDGPREYIRLWKTEARSGMAADELEWMRNVVERNPSPPALLRFALATGVNDRPQDAADTLVRLCNMHRTARCDEGRQSWAQLQSQYPVLNAIAYPLTPGQP